MMTEEEYKKYKEALLLFYGGGRYILNNRYLPGIPTLPDIQEYTITFTNLDYPDLPIVLPDPMTDISGTVVTLPTISGEYEDVYNYYTPESWSIGSFGSEIELSDNLTANLIFNVVPKVVTYTVSFENTTYPDFDVSIPDSIIVPEGDSITLPSVSGEYEDEEYTYTPLKWSIGEFGEVITPDSNLTGDLVWNVVPVQQENVIGGLISETESIDWKSISVLGNMEVDNVNLYSEITQLGTLSVDNIALTQDFYMLGKLMRDYDPAIEDATFIVYDTLEDSIVSYYKQELVYSEIEGIVLNSPEIIIGVPQTVPNRSFFFTENGREEINNTVLQGGSTLPLYDESGNLITDADTIALYDNSQALSFMKEDGNMEQALNSDLLVDNDGELSLQLSSQTRSRNVEQEETLTIDSTFGADVTIPEGYVVDQIKTNVFFINKPSTNSWSGYDETFSFVGDGKYCDLVNTNLIGKGVSPCLQIFCVVTVNGHDDYLGWWASYRPTQSSQYGPSSYNTVYLNSNGYFLYIALRWPDFLTSQSVGEALRNGYPLQIRYYDENNTRVDYYFNIPRSLWDYDNGTITWKGDVEDNTTLAYYYYNLPIRIVCKRAIDLRVKFGEEVTIPEGYSIESVKSTSAFAFGESTNVTPYNKILKYNGRDIYTTNIITSDVGIRILPCLTIFQGTSWHDSTTYYELYGYRLSTSPSYHNNNNSPTAITDVSVNDSVTNSFVTLNVHWSDLTTPSNVETGIQNYPAQFMYRDETDLIVSYFFNLPETLWQYDNGIFSWLGDTEDSHNIAFYYRKNQGGHYIRIRCVPIPFYREITAWSVQVERVFVLQFSNSEHPSLDIPMPADETGYKGTSITLPTMSGEYESGGKTWKPSAWDIGAFGDSYTLNADTVARLIFEEVENYEFAFYGSSPINFVSNSYISPLRKTPAGTILPYIRGKTYTAKKIYSSQSDEVGVSVDSSKFPMVDEYGDGHQISITNYSGQAIMFYKLAYTIT